MTAKTDYGVILKAVLKSSRREYRRMALSGGEQGSETKKQLSDEQLLKSSKCMFLRPGGTANIKNSRTTVRYDDTL